MIRLVIAVSFLLALSGAARAFTIQEVKSSGGITAWLVEEHAIPLIAMKFSFPRGSLDDPAGKEGVAELLSAMIDEGAGDLLSKDYQARRDGLAMRMSFEASKDYFEGSFQTLARNRDAAFEHLRLGMTAPRFDADPLERMRQQLTVAARERETDPQRMAMQAWMNLAMPGDPYTRPTGGTEASLKAITADDLRAAHHRIFARRGLQVAVVGDISAAELGPLLDKVFGGLPEGVPSGDVAPTKVEAGPKRTIVPFDIPQSLIVFGHEGIRRDDPDFISAYVMMEILGGGSFESRLTNEIREKRGLTYGVGFGLSPARRGGLVIGSLQTSNDSAGEALALAEAEIARMSSEGPTQAELDAAKTYLTGSYALRFSSNSAIASQLLGLQQENLGIDYVERRNSLIEALTLDDLKAAARRLLQPGRLIVTVVGQPKGLN